MRIIMKRKDFLDLLDRARTEEKKALQQQMTEARRQRFKARIGQARSLLMPDSHRNETISEYLRRLAG